MDMTHFMGINYPRPATSPKIFFLNILLHTFVKVNMTFWHSMFSNIDKGKFITLVIPERGINQ